MNKLFFPLFFLWSQQVRINHINDSYQHKYQYITVIQKLYTKASRGFYVPLSHPKRVNWLSCNVVGSFPLVRGMLLAAKTDKSITLLLHSERFSAIQKDTRYFLSYSLSSIKPISSRFLNKITPNSVICNFSKILRKNTMKQRFKGILLSLKWTLIVYITRSTIIL